MVVDGGCTVEFRQEFVELVCAKWEGTAVYSFLNTEIYSRALTRFFPNSGNLKDAVITAGTPPSPANLSPPSTTYPDSTPPDQPPLHRTNGLLQEDGNRQGKDIVRAQRHGEGNQEME
ncbi:hypothetical protein LXL04_011672 [Taraxacum kok-saghyz]